MHRIPTILLFGAAALAALFALRAGQGAGQGAAPGGPGPRIAPEFPAREAASWVGLPAGTAPPTMASLHGRVVVMNVWTFG